jgi:hypothetical protein
VKDYESDIRKWDIHKIKRSKRIHQGDTSHYMKYPIRRTV